MQDGDIISLNLPNRTITLNVTDTELAKRKALWQPPQILHKRGYPKLFIKEVLQANEGCDFDFLKPKLNSDLPFIEPIVGRS